jgi:hypothetical protein
MNDSNTILDNGHHPEFARGIREAAAKCEFVYRACFEIAMGGERWSEDLRNESMTRGVALLGVATDILALIGEEPFLISQEKQRVREEQAAAAKS